MKRHESLIPLSRFHRSCLLLALIAKENAPAVKGYPKVLAEKIAYANTFFEEQLSPHFEYEQGLWDYVKDKSTEINEILIELETERAELISLFNKLAKSKDAHTFHTIGHLLEKHVRKEERVLFQQIQADLTEEELLHIKTLI